MKKEKTLYEKRQDTNKDTPRFKRFAYAEEDIKSACNFYLRYKDKPKLLIEEQSIFLKKIMEDLEMIKTDPNYNEWLFKLAFKDVLEEK